MERYSHNTSVSQKMYNITIIYSYGGVDQVITALHVDEERVADRIKQWLSCYHVVQIVVNEVES